MNGSKLDFYYEAVGLKTLVISGLATLAAIAIVALIAFIVIRAIRNRQ